MAKSRSFVGGPRWPNNYFINAAPALASGGTLAALNDRFIIVGQIVSDDGATHSYDTVILRTHGGSLTGTLTVGFADVDTANGPPARDDGTIDQTGTQVNPASGNTYTITLGASRSLAHGAEIAVVAKITAFTSGSTQIAVVGANAASGNAQRPACTSFIASVYAAETGGQPMVSLLASGDGHYATIKGCFPTVIQAVDAVAINTGSGNTRAALGFTVAAPVWGVEGRVFITNAAGGSFDIRLYDGTSQMATYSIDANTWNADSDARWVNFCFADQAFVTGHSYYVAIVPTTATNVTMYILTATAVRWNAITGAVGGGSVGYATYAGSWSAIDTAVQMLMQIEFVAVDDASGGGTSGNANILGGSVIA